MKQLWAPWRLEFIQDNANKPAKTSNESLFKTLGEQEPAKENLLLFKGKTAFIILNKFPYANGHMMVIPYRQVSDFTALTSEEHQEMGELMSQGIAVLKKAYDPQGFNVGLNLGRAAGAGIAEHLHYHIVPRWDGDTNFMPIFAETKALPEHIEATYEKLKSLFDGK